METQWKKLSLLWLLILGIFAQRKTQAAYHKHEMKFTAVGTSKGLLDLIGVAFIDGIQWASYYKSSQKIVVKPTHIYEALGENFLKDMDNEMKDQERGYHHFIQYLTRNDKTESNHTMQLYLDCELDEDTHLSSLVKYGFDGEDFIEIDEHGKWKVLHPWAHSFEDFYEGPDIAKLLNKKYCIGAMLKILQKSSMKESLPPEVYVSRQEFPNGTISFSCTATGFYSQSILMHWKKGVDEAILGKESSSNILPNYDDTFYCRISLEIQPGDSGTGYACVVNHSHLETPTVYPVPEKPSEGNIWVIVLSILLAAILMISCFVIFKKWRKTYSSLHC
ncbi:major histocompatibility complex class I-related gene protein-like isoform X1 [Monodelphis domestica]|uniref:major histocompatibility complex class I-related gene protein-like isoform X1 n=1 Tax=Monodelphis domestica TaxID=13616 RepID=UPI0024E212A8|nr:major histocompatibility complex class I-related gene protein-like isoform X1 [Monodelphis domestica]